MLAVASIDLRFEHTVPIDMYWAPAIRCNLSPHISATATCAAAGGPWNGDLSSIKWTFRFGDGSHDRQGRRIPTGNGHIFGRQANTAMAFVPA